MSLSALTRVAVPIALAALLAAACGGSSKQPPHAGSVPAPSTKRFTTSVGANATTAPATGAKTIPPNTTGVARPVKLCRARGLVLSYLGGQGATGHGELGFALRNISGHPCHTFGYPGIRFLDSSGRPLPTASRRTTHDFFGSAPLAALLIRPGSSFSFRIGVTHGEASSAGCTTAARLSVIPPDNTSSLHVELRNGAYECGTATVSPVRPGHSAYIHG